MYRFSIYTKEKDKTYGKKIGEMHVEIIPTVGDKRMSISKSIFKILTILTGTILYFGIVSGSFAETYYVNPQTGNINNNGSSTSPWSTLQEVFSSNKINTAVAPGDTLLLLSGYHGLVW